jgi:rhodanese-related sulfurtransferase
MSLSKIFLVLLSLSLILFTACSEDSTTEPTPAVDEFALVTEVGDVYFSTYTTANLAPVNITVASLFDNLNDGDASNDPYIIDWRAADAYASGHIVGAVNMALGDLVTNLDNGTVPSDRTILNICYTGQTASVATSFLNLLGYEAQNLKYGMCGVTDDANIIGTDKWALAVAADEYALNMTDAGTPTNEYDYPVLDTGKDNAVEIIKARFAPAEPWGVAVAADEYALNMTDAGTPTNEYDYPVLDTGKDNAVEIIKARFAPAEPWGVAVASVIAAPDDYFVINYWAYADYMNIGHIEGAYQFTPNADFVTTGKLKNLPTDKKIAVYCWTGQTSAQVVTYLRILGYDAYSIYYGVNGFAFNSLPETARFHAPSADYSSIITQ